MEKMENCPFPELQENVRVKIVHAENVYVNCHMYNQDNSRTKDENDESEVGSWRTQKANTSVQTESEEISCEHQNMGMPKRASDGETDDNSPEVIVATPQALPVVTESGVDGCSKESCKENKPRDRTRIQDVLTRKFQELNLDTSAETTLARPLQRNLSTDSCPTPSTPSVSFTQEEEKVVTSLELFSKLVEEKFPYIGEKAKKDLIKVIIVHSEADKDMAKEIVEKLRKNKVFWAITNSELESIISVNFADNRKAAIAWADILVPLITNTWLKEIDNVCSSKRSTSSLTARYTFQLIQSNFISSGCTNYKIISAVKEGTDKDFRHRPELRDAILLMRDYEKFEKTIIDFTRLVKLYNNHR